LIKPSRIEARRNQRANEDTAMRNLLMLAAAGSAALALVAGPGLAQAQPYDDGHHHHRHHHYQHHDDGCRAGRRHDANVGTVVGAIGGGLIGNAIGHGRPVGTIVGAGAGAVAGHEIAKNNHPC
jgi:uncharacterized protein YcfJ